MKINIKTSKYVIDTTSQFRNQLKKVYKQGKDISKLIDIVVKLGNNEELDVKYRDHDLINDKNYKDCRECHITPDWLLIYKKQDDKLILVLFATGSHSELFNK